jgi:predicted Holliday junction resolvase-like endonuclease
MTDSFLDTFQQFKMVLCICPKCSTLSRLSDLQLRSMEKAPKTWLDDYDIRSQKLTEQENEFAEKESEIREKATERGRAQVPEIIRRSMNAQFAKLSYDPYDIKPLLHPVEFVIFDGMNKGELNNVTLLSRISMNPNLQNLQKSVTKIIDEKAYDWKVLRVSSDGDIEYE